MKLTLRTGGLMKVSMTVVAVLASAGCASALLPDTKPVAAPQKTAQECGVNLGRYMNMDPEAFNSKLGKGWREIADKDGCLVAAADLIALYRAERIEAWKQNLNWHEAQLRAGAGDTAGALALFYQVAAADRVKAESGDTSMRAELLYAEGTIAFLKRDRRALEAARAELLALPVPADFELSIRMFKQNYPTQTPPTWPLHLKELDGFLANFDKPYAEAYGAAVRDPVN